VSNALLLLFSPSIKFPLTINGYHLFWPNPNEHVGQLYGFFCFSIYCYKNFFSANEKKMQNQD